MKKYKVLTQKDKWFSGRFDPAALEQALNDLASEGWRVISMTSSSREGFVAGGGKDEIVILLERDVSQPAPRPKISDAAEDGVYRL